MSIPWKKVSLTFVCFVAGCGHETIPPLTDLAPTPLSVAQWRALPVGEKYDDATFERLKMQDAQLQTDRGWDRFMVETVIPDRQKDFPDDFVDQNDK